MSEKSGKEQAEMQNGSENKLTILDTEETTVLPECNAPIAVRPFVYRAARNMKDTVEFERRITGESSKRRR